MGAEPMNLRCQSPLPISLLLALCLAPAAGRAEEPVALHEQFPPGSQYHVSTRVDLSGSLSLPAVKGQPAPKSLTVAGDSAIEYDERILTRAADGQVQK